MSKSNPQTKSLRVVFAKPDSWVRKSGFMRISDTHCNLSIVLRIRWIHLIFWKLAGFMLNDLNWTFLKLQICDSNPHESFDFQICGLQTEMNLFKPGFVVNDLKQIHVFTNLLYESRNLSFYTIVRWSFIKAPS
jgi:hypothetical protein